MIGWPPPGGNWEGGTVIDGRRLVHVPHVGWCDNGPAGPPRPYVHRPPARLTDGRIYRDPRTMRPGPRLARWLHLRRHGIVALAALLVVAAYAATILLVFDRTLPTLRSAAALVAVGAVAVAVLLPLVLWARRDD